MDALLYREISREELEELLYSFYHSVEIPLQLIDQEGNLLLRLGDESAYCKKVDGFLPAEQCCQRTHLLACKQSVILGESYIFSCSGNLNHIIFPFLRKDILLGGVLLGPFLMDQADSTLMSQMAIDYHLPTEAVLDLYDNAREIPVLSPSKVRQISKLLGFSLRHFLDDSKETLLFQQVKSLQQSRISDSIQMYKNSGHTQEHYPYEKEKMLMTKMKTGDMLGAKGILNDLLGYVLFSRGNSIDAIQLRSIELCSVLSRAAMESGAPSQQLLTLNEGFLKSFLSIHDFDEICMKLQEAVQTFSSSILVKSQGKQQDLIKKSAKYLAEHFAEPLNLELVANEVHLSPSYFSTLFKESTGSSFKEYLNKIRIEESKTLLSNTDYSILDIATAVGFEDQSYFSKVFRRFTGYTPKQYRSF